MLTQELYATPGHENILQLAANLTGITADSACLVGAPLCIKKSSNGDVLLCCNTEVSSGACYGRWHV